MSKALRHPTTGKIVRLENGKLRLGAPGDPCCCDDDRCVTCPTTTPTTITLTASGISVPSLTSCYASTSSSLKMSSSATSWNGTFTLGRMGAPYDCVWIANPFGNYMQLSGNPTCNGWSSGGVAWHARWLGNGWRIFAGGAWTLPPWHVTGVHSGFWHFFLEVAAASCCVGVTNASNGISTLDNTEIVYPPSTVYPSGWDAPRVYYPGGGQVSITPNGC